jgi:hypothetical protein
VLCASCIVARAAKLPGVTIVYMNIDDPRAIVAAQPPADASEWVCVRCGGDVLWCPCPNGETAEVASLGETAPARVDDKLMWRLRYLTGEANAANERARVAEERLRDLQTTASPLPPAEGLEQLARLIVDPDDPFAYADTWPESIKNADEANAFNAGVDAVLAALTRARGPA